MGIIEMASSEARNFSPPSRGLALGWRLALSTALIVGLVMASISLGQQFLELRQQRQVHQNLLVMSLMPLVVRLEAATKLKTLEREVEEFRTAFVKKGYPMHEIVLLDSSNKTVFFTGELPDDQSGMSHFQTTIPINSPLLDGEHGSLIVSINSLDYPNTVRREWWLWTIHFVVTLGVVLLFLSAAIYFQVTKPVSGLVRIVKKMERGYWGPIDIGGGAWEIRWLAWRFNNMAQEVQRTMTKLLEAQQKARSAAAIASRSNEIADQQQRSGSVVIAPDHTDCPAYRALLAVCEQLERMSPDDPKAAELGRHAWEREAVEANRLGFHEIKARLENAALRLMEPDTYRSLNEDLSELTAFWQEWTKQCCNELYRLLEGASIPCAGVLHRVKHTAGVWEKMQSKELNMNEIHDLFAFRIIVPTEADCYAALGVIHNEYQPLITRFKDYIAEPKENGYSSLHTCVTADGGPVFEVQIRSIIMDRQAERGNAAHWVYKGDARKTKSKSVFKHWSRKFLRCGGIFSAP